MKTLITFISQYDPIGVKFKHPIKKMKRVEKKRTIFEEPCL